MLLFGYASILLGDFDNAQRVLQKSHSIAREDDDNWRMVEALEHLGQLFVRRGNTVVANRYLSHAMGLAERLDLHGLRANCAHWLGVAATLDSRSGAAESFLQSSLDAYRSFSDRRGEVRAITAQGWLALSQNDLPAAWGCLQNSLAIHRQLTDRLGGIEAFELAAMACAASGLAADAVALMGAYHSQRKAMNAPLPPALERTQRGRRSRPRAPAWTKHSGSEVGHAARA